MKKKMSAKKLLAAGGLALGCVAVLVATLYLTRDRGSDFVPEPTQSTAPSGSWTETPGSATPSTGWEESNPAGQNPAPGTPAPDTQYPKEVTTEDGNVVIQFTEPVSKPDPPEDPPADPDSPTTSKPIETPSSSKPPSTPPPKTDSSSPPPASNSNGGGSDHPGQVYDPVFGWTDITGSEGQKVDSSGDPNKMVGTMGE